MKYNFITIGGATRDVAFFTDKGLLLDNTENPLRQKLLAFEYGAKIRIDKFVNLFGGGATNAAVNLAGLGFKTAALVEVGADENGRSILKNIKQRGVISDLVSVNSKIDSGSSFILITKSGERIIFTTRGANDFLTLSPKCLKAIDNAENIYIASLSGSWLKDLKQIFSRGHRKIFWNPGAMQYDKGVKVLSPFFKKTYCLMLNREEALSLILSDPTNSKRSPLFFEDIKNLLLILKSYGPEIVVITDGKNGANFFDGVKFHHQKVQPEKKHVDTTGIGDCYNSTFAAGLLIYQGDIRKAAILASKNSAHKIAYLGAQNGLLTKKDLIK